MEIHIYIILVLVLTHINYINYHVLLVLRYKYFVAINYKIVTKIFKAMSMQLQAVCQHRAVYMYLHYPGE